MKRKYGFPIMLMSIVIIAGFTRNVKPKVLVFTKTAGYVHASIPDGVKAIRKLGKKNSFEVDTSSSASAFTNENLKKYAALIFLHTTDTADALFNAEQKKAFQNYIREGGGFAGIHAASDAGYEWDWYAKLVGANFLSHPKQQVARIQVVDKNHPSTRHLPDTWTRKDEWYNYKNINPDIHVLMKLDESSYNGGENGNNHPIAWYHEFEGGRSWYTGLGHTEESYEEPKFLAHLLGGIQYAMGVSKK